MNEEMRLGAPLTPVDFDPFADRSIDELLPLTEPQSEVWTAAQISDAASCAYNMCFPLNLRGPLAAESLQSALQQVVDRHEGLRVRIETDGKHHKITAPSPIPFPVIDLSGESPESRAKEIARILNLETTQPFDLANGPLWRAKLVRESKDRHRLIITLHHIVCDGWSLGVFFSDLAGAYDADRHGLKAQLPPVASYRDYVLGEAEHAAGSLTRSDEEYWVQQYSDSVPVLELPVDVKRPALKTYNGGCQTLRVDATLYGALKTFGARQGCTLYVTLLAGFEALLSRLSGQNDLVVGVPMAGQALLDNGHLVAHCINLVPLRARIDPAARFVDHLKSVRSAFLEAQAHQRLTFGSLVRELNVPRDPSRTPLVSVTFNLDKVGAGAGFSDLVVEAAEGSSQRTVNFEISINAVDTGRDLLVQCYFNTDLFTSRTISRWLGSYQILLEAAVSGGERRLDELPLLGAVEREQLVEGWNATTTQYPRERRVEELFVEQASAHPQAVAVRCEGQSLSYRELDERANRLARHLRALGVGPDVMVGLCFERSLELAVALLGILKAGGAYVPLDPAYPAERLAFMLEDTGAPVLVTTSKLLGGLPKSAARSVCLDTDWPVIEAQSAEAVESGGNADHLAYVIYTSGSKIGRASCRERV